MEKWRVKIIFKPEVVHVSLISPLKMINDLGVGFVPIVFLMDEWIFQVLQHHNFQGGRMTCETILIVKDNFTYVTYVRSGQDFYVRTETAGERQTTSGHGN